MQSTLLDEATAHRDARIVDVGSIAEAVEASADGFARIPWSVVGPEGEAALGQHAITVRCLVDADGAVAATEDGEGNVAIVGRSY
jgi:prolyl-tRNA synthetase